MPTNTTVALMVAAAGGLAVWVGIVDPPGGISGALGSVLRGQPVNAKPASSSGLAKYVSAIWTPGASTGASNLTASAPTAGSGAAVLAESAKYLGTRYAFGGEDPATGFDCSGLVQYVYARAAGLNLPRTAASQALTGNAVALADAVPGDLLFWGVPAYHCGIYLGGDSVRHAPKTGDVVKDSKLWSKSTITVRRVLAGATTPSAKALVTV